MTDKADMVLLALKLTAEADPMPLLMASGLLSRLPSDRVQAITCESIRMRLVSVLDDCAAMIECEREEAADAVCDMVRGIAEGRM